MKTKQKLNEMMSEIPTESNGKNIDTQLLRIGILSELDAINLYDQLTDLATDETVKAAFLDIAKEEKTHVGEFQALLNGLDKENQQEMEVGKKEVEDLKDEPTKQGTMEEARQKIYGKSKEQQLIEFKNLWEKVIK